MRMDSKPPFGGEVVRLGDVCEVNPKTECGLPDDELVSFLPLAAVHTNGSTDLGDETRRGDVRKGHPNFRRGDILLAKITPSFENGKIAIALTSHKYGYSSTEFHVIRPKGATVNTGYLLAFLRSGKTVDYCAHRMKGSAGQKRVPADVIKNLKLVLPSFSRQEQISMRFDEITDLIKLQDARIAKLDELVKSRFVEMFGDSVANPVGWRTDMLGHLGTCKNGLNFKAEDSGYEVTCLGVGNFGDRSSIEDMSLLEKVELSERPKEDCFLKDGDIVFVRSNGNKALVGRCLAVYPHGEELVYSGFCIRFRLSSGSLRVPFLVWTLKQPSMRTQLMGRGSNVKNLNQRILSSLEVPIPPIELQDEFISFASRVDKLRVGAQEQKERLQTLYDSLAQEYFAIGE